MLNILDATQKPAWNSFDLWYTVEATSVSYTHLTLPTNREV